MWSRKSAMLGSLAIAMYLLGLTLRNEQLVTIAVVIFVFLTWAALLVAMLMLPLLVEEQTSGPVKKESH